MYLLVKFGRHSSCRNGVINSYINCYINNLEKAELITLVRHIQRFSKSRIPIYNSEVPDTAGRKTRRGRRTQAIAKRFAFYANTISEIDDKAPENFYYDVLFNKMIFIFEQENAC